MYSTLYNTWIKYRIVTFNFEKLQRKPFITNRIDARQDKGVHVITKRTLNVLGKPSTSNAIKRITIIIISLIIIILIILIFYYT